MLITAGLKHTLTLLMRHGLKDGLKKARFKKIPSVDISNAKNMAVKNPKRFLPKWDSRNKSATQRRIEAQERAEQLKRVKRY
tara:strand:+ start:224 stop:469 length:246 start_codon:yes stop_codon:yes gene_type:complete